MPHIKLHSFVLWQYACIRIYIDGMNLTSGSNFTECLNKEMVSKWSNIFVIQLNQVGTLLISHTAYVEWFRAHNVWLEPFTTYQLPSWHLLNFGKNKAKRELCDKHVSLVWSYNLEFKCRISSLCISYAEYPQITFQTDSRKTIVSRKTISFFCLNAFALSWSAAGKIARDSVKRSVLAC